MVKRVIIIGAGFAGLTAANTLRKEGGDAVNVIVLEGGNRVGGRANTQEVDGLGKVEFGATYLHGMKGHLVYEAAENSGLLGPVHTKDLRWGFVRQGEAAPVDNDSFQRVQRAVKAYAAARDAEPGDDFYDPDTIGNKLAKAAKKELAKLSPEEQEEFLRAWRWHEVQLMVNTSSPASAIVSSAWWEVCEDLEGPNFPIPAGFQTVAEVMAEGLDIRFESVVTSINYEGEGVFVRVASGEVFEADAVIVTISLGVLKATHHKLFVPPLPKSKATAIAALGWGHNEKLIVDYGAPPCAPEPASSPPTIAYNLLWDVPFPGPAAPSPMVAEVDADGLPNWAHGIFSFRFGGSEIKPREVPSSCAQAVDPFGAKYGSASDKFFGNSSIEMAHIAANTAQTPPDKMPPLEQHPRVACLWVSGWHAQALALATDEEIEAGLEATVQQFPAMPLQHVKPKRILRSKWGSDPLFRGAYSFVTGDPADNARLAEPVLSAGGQPVVMFAGEATTATKTASTNGACLTGRREAWRWLQAHGLMHGTDVGAAKL